MQIPNTPITLEWQTKGDDKVSDNVFLKLNKDGWNTKFKSTPLPHADIEIVLQILSISRDKSGMALGIARNNLVLDKESLTSLQEEVCINAKGFHYQYKTQFKNKYELNKDDIVKIRLLKSSNQIIFLVKDVEVATQTYDYIGEVFYFVLLS